jgi:hypothetical protein
MSHAQFSLFLLLFMIVMGTVVTACSKESSPIVGSWQVISGPNMDAVYEFTENGDFYVYRVPGQLGNAFWYGWAVTKNKRSAELRPIEDIRDSLTLSEQGLYEMQRKQRIKLWPQHDDFEHGLTSLDGPVLEIVSITDKEMTIKEYQPEIESSKKTKLNLVGEMKLNAISTTPKE